MASILHHLAPSNDVDLINILDCRESVSNGDGCSSNLSSIQSILYNLRKYFTLVVSILDIRVCHDEDESDSSIIHIYINFPFITCKMEKMFNSHLFTLSVESRCSLIEEQDPRITHQSPGNSYPLLLTTRQLSSLAPHLGVVTRWQRRDKVVDVGSPGSVHHLLHAHLSLIVPVLDVVRDGSVKQDRLLRHETKLGSEPGQIQSLNILLLNVQISRLQIIQSLNQLKYNHLSIEYINIE